MIVRELDDRPPSQEKICLRCGKCCGLIPIRLKKKDLPNTEDGKLIAKIWKRVKRPKGKPKGFYYTCSWLDKETHLCKHYEKRPRVCREYPFYDRPKLKKSVLLNQIDCGYLKYATESR